MATHFYYDGHTYEIETAPLNWVAANSNANSLIWDDGDRFAITVTSYLVDINSTGESQAIAKNIKASVTGAEALITTIDSIPYLWTGQVEMTIDKSGMLYPQDGTLTLWSVIEWDGLLGTSGNDKLTGTTRDDVIDGRAGNDMINGGEGNDIIYAGTGDDKINAGNGNNWVFADTGTKDEDDGNDSITAGTGDDFLASGTGNDTIKAGDGDNIVIGGDGDDKITTGSGDDVVDVDGYYTDSGDASLGNDTIKTGAGNDYIVLGEGFDKVWGGPGNDTFVLSFLPDATVTNTVVNQNGSTTTTYLSHKIYDFDAGSNGGVADILGLDGDIFTSLGTTVSATNFVKGPGLNAAPGNETGHDDYLIYDTNTGRLYYDADGNGTESDPILIAVVRGKVTDFNYEDIAIV